MENQLTRLIFDFDENSREGVTPKQLFEIVDALEVFVEAAFVHGSARPPSVAPFANANRAFSFELVAPPTRGSLVFKFRLKVDAEFLAKFRSRVEPSLGTESKRALLTRLSEGAVIGAFLLQLVFGDGGLWQHMPVSGDRNSIAPRNADDIRPDLLAAPLRDASMNLYSRTIFGACEKTRATVVSIAVDDEPQLVLWNRVSRIGKGVLKNLKKSNVPPTANWLPQNVSRVGAEEVRVRFRGKAYVAFQAKPTPNFQEPTLVIWGSAEPVPQPDQSPIEVEWVAVDDPEDIELIDPLPVSLEHSQRVLFVAAAEGRIMR